MTPIVTLANRRDFTQFAPHINEQLITPTGRMLVPSPQFQIQRLDEQTEYKMSLKMRKVSSKRQGWYGTTFLEQAVKKKDENPESNEVEHPLGAKSGTFWMENIVKFENLLMATARENVKRKPGVIYVHSLFKYIPVLTVTPLTHDESEKRMSSGTSSEFSFVSTEFITVSKYYNKKIVEMKVRMNKFSNGKRKNYPDAEDVTPPLTKKSRRRSDVFTPDTSSSSTLNSSSSSSEEEENISITTKHDTLPPSEAQITSSAINYWNDINFHQFPFFNPYMESQLQHCVYLSL